MYGKNTVIGGRRYDRYNREKMLMTPKYIGSSNESTTFLKIDELNLFPVQSIDEQDILNIKSIR